MSKTKVMYRASLSYTQLKYYEDYLQTNRLIEITEDELWKLTEKGRRYLQACKLADQILKMPSTSAPPSEDDDLVAAAAESRPLR